MEYISNGMYAYSERSTEFVIHSETFERIRIVIIYMPSIAIRCIDSDIHKNVPIPISIFSASITRCRYSQHQINFMKKRMHIGIVKMAVA